MKYLEIRALDVRNSIFDLIFENNIQLTMHVVFTHSSMLAISDVTGYQLEQMGKLRNETNK